MTVKHTIALLQKMNDHEKHVVAKDAEKVVGYVLAMTKALKAAVPILVPMFEVFDMIQFQHKKISEFNYLVVGQVCIDKTCRSQGIFDGIYNAYRKLYAKKYDFAITEIATENIRSLQAHKRIGFEIVHAYTASDNVDWTIVIWNWR